MIAGDAAETGELGERDVAEATLDEPEGARDEAHGFAMPDRPAAPAAIAELVLGHGEAEAHGFVCCGLG